MFEKRDKKRLYWLVNQFLSEKINARFFCDEYYYSYDLEIDDGDLTKLEREIFQELSVIVGRFSEFEDDIKKYPDTYITEGQLKENVQTFQKKLHPRQN